MKLLSLTYPERTETNFPEAVDNLTRMSDLSFEDLPLVQQYYDYYNSGNLSGANALLEANPMLKNKIFNAAKFNKLSDGIGAVQQFFKEKLQDYLNEQLTYAEEYNPSTTYKKTNIISYNGEGFICRRDTSIGIAPINGQSTSNWGLISKQGVQGASGVGLSPRGVWNDSTQYYIDDFVSHGQKFWQSLTNNINSEPSIGNADWLKLVDVGVVDDYIIATDVGEATEYSPVEADKLRTPIKIGNADFDGSTDISLASIGAVQLEDLIDSRVDLSPDVATALGLTGNPQVKDALEKLSGAALRKTVGVLTEVPVSSFVIGNTYNLFGTQFICCASDYPVAESKMLIKKFQLPELSVWSGLGDFNEKTNTFFNGLPIEFQNICLSVTIGTQVINKKCFNLSAKELGGNEGEGAYIPYFNNGTRMANSTQRWWTRTEANYSNAYAVSNDNGALVTAPKGTGYGVKPVIVLQNSTLLYKDINGTHTKTQNCSNVLTDMLGNDFPLPYAKIEIGSYFGTGVYGSNNSNSLTFPRKPVMVIINCYDGSNSSVLQNNTSIFFINAMRTGIYTGSYGYYGGTALSTSDANWSAYNDETNNMNWFSNSSAAVQMNHSGVKYTTITFYE